jgi:uncharacterized protein YdeI (YjbR/CyaY-like superfamily)
MKKCRAGNRKEWRAWLRKNHLKERGVQLISFKKHTGRPFLRHKEAMEEAICFGWIDTTIKRIDEDTFARTFVRRGDKARWSENTLGYGKELLKKGRMSAIGKKRFLEGLSRKTHDHGRVKNPRMPSDLKKALGERPTIRKKFGAVPKSTKKFYFIWLSTAKLPVTRKKRIKEILTRTRKGLRLGVLRMCKAACTKV